MSLRVFGTFLKYKRFLLPLLLLPLYFILYKIYMPKINAFGCFDDCFNYLGGYFILKGKTLYSQIFFNHQPLMAFISFLVQFFSHPSNIYELILRHRQFLFVFAFLMNALIVIRFGIAGFGFALFYELIKFYLFGDRFLAESFIVYPLVYMTGLALLDFFKKKLYNVDFILSSLFTFFILFMREPYAPLALLLFAFLLLKSGLKTRVAALTVFVFLSVFILTKVPLNDLIFNVYTVNSKTVFMMEAQNNNLFGAGLLKSFIYPFYLPYFLSAENFNLFKLFAITFDLIFLILLFYFSFKNKKIKLFFFIILIMGLANLRPNPPGRIFYSSFTMISWYGILIFTTFFFLKEIYLLKKKITLIFIVFLTGLLAYVGFSPDSFVQDKVDPHSEFMTNYGHILRVGEAVKSLSGENDTLFLDGFDDLIYWQADRISSYKYSWYTSVMPSIGEYTKARMEMFGSNLPDFYYGSCPKEQNSFRLMPQKAGKYYEQLYSGGKPSCLYVKKTKISRIKPFQWQKARELLYELKTKDD